MILGGLISSTVLNLLVLPAVAARYYVPLASASRPQTLRTTRDRKQPEYSGNLAAVAAAEGACHDLGRLRVAWCLRRGSNGDSRENWRQRGSLEPCGSGPDRRSAPSGSRLVIARGEHSALKDMKTGTWVALVLSGIATGISWLAYFKALQLAPASSVAPLDKLSLPITVILAALVLGEGMTWRMACGVLLMVGGAIIATRP